MRRRINHLTCRRTTTQVWAARSITFDGHGTDLYHLLTASPGQSVQCLEHESHDPADGEEKAKQRCCSDAPNSHASRGLGDHWHPPPSRQTVLCSERVPNPPTSTPLQATRPWIFTLPSPDEQRRRCRGHRQRTVSARTAGNRRSGARMNGRSLDGWRGALWAKDFPDFFRVLAMWWVGDRMRDRGSHRRPPSPARVSQQKGARSASVGFRDAFPPAKLPLVWDGRLEAPCKTLWAPRC